MSIPIGIDEPPNRPETPPAFALWQLGFRPFYLLASSFGALSIALWALQISGHLGHPYLQGPAWHAHEMLFGFTLAVVVGFLFTAGRNWSSRPTPTGRSLAALALLWVAGRVLVLTPYGWAAALANAAFPLAAAIALARVFVPARNRRNYFFVGVLGLMSCAVLAFHLAQLGVVRLTAWTGIRVALDLLLFVLVVMGGRVIPMFTENTLPGAPLARRPAWDRIALGSVLLLACADALQLPASLLAVLAAIAAAAHSARWASWKPWRTARVPLLWVLHAAYLWVPLHLLLRCLAESGWAAPSLATHALTVGAAGGMIIGMMTRTARGHTGRPLRADRADVACYALVLSSGVVRVALPLLAPTLTMNAIVVSASLWSAGFGLYAVRYWPVLTRARADDKPG
jgi:uncharacterized protein involved in response to NO